MSSLERIKLSPVRIAFRDSVNRIAQPDYYDYCKGDVVRCAAWIISTDMAVRIEVMDPFCRPESRRLNQTAEQFIYFATTTALNGQEIVSWHLDGNGLWSSAHGQDAPKQDPITTRADQNLQAFMARAGLGIGS